MMIHNTVPQVDHLVFFVGHARDRAGLKADRPNLGYVAEKFDEIVAK